jgi:predicted extracellular nuclease
MLIAIEDELTVTNNFYLGRFGQVRLNLGERLAQPTNVVLPGAPAIALQELNNRSYVTIDDANPTQNVDPIVFPAPQLTFTDTLRGGDLVPDGIVGVVDHYTSDSSDDYRVFPVEEVVFSQANTRPATPADVGGTIKVASFNVLNYFSTIDTGPDICGPSQNMDCRGADSAEEFARQRVKIINAIVAMDADIVGLMELENHITDEALQDLVDGLNEAAGAGTYAFVNTGVIGTDAIKVALIYQPASVTPSGDYAILDSSVDPAFIDTLNRPVLIQTFAENATNELVTVAVNHLKSKGSACTGDPDLGDGQGNCNLTRVAAAEALVNYLADDPTNSGVDRYLIIGDLNSYAMEDPIQAIEAAGYTNLVSLFEGADAYGYTFEGQWGYLDHALASADLLPLVTGAAPWHINSDEPIVLDYNMEFKTANQHVILFGEEPYKASDHDPVVIGLDLVTVVPTVDILSPVNGQVFTSTNGTAVSVPVTITTTDFVIPADGHWHLWVDGVDTGPVMDYATTVDLLPGTHVITAELNSPTHESLGISDSVTVTVVVEYTIYLPVIMKP